MKKFWTVKTASAEPEEKLLQRIGEKRTFILEAPEAQLATLVEMAKEGSDDRFATIFVAYLVEVDIFKLCNAKTLNDTFFIEMKDKPSFLKVFLCHFKLGITADFLNNTIEANARKPFVDFLRALENDRSLMPVMAQPNAASISLIEMKVMLSVQAFPRHNVWQYLAENRFSVTSWLQLGWTLIANILPDYEAVAFQNDQSNTVVVVYDHENLNQETANTFFASLLSFIPEGYTFLHLTKDSTYLM